MRQLLGRQREFVHRTMLKDELGVCSAPSHKVAGCGYYFFGVPWAFSFNLASCARSFARRAVLFRLAIAARAFSPLALDISYLHSAR